MTTILGLTGSIGMGKTTTAAIFAEAGVPVWDADAAVHRLYAPGGAAVEPIRALHPNAIRDGAVERRVLRDWIAADPSALRQIEAVVHPLVAADRRDFIARSDTDIVVLDIPLLFETGGAAEVDRVVVVTAPPDVQRARVLARPGMTAGGLERLLSRQMPDAEKRARADYIVETTSLEHARQSVHNILRDIRGERHA